MISNVDFIGEMAVLVLAVILLPLATARLTRLIVRDIITEFLRIWIYRRFGEDSAPAKLVQCHWCAAVWMSAVTSSFAWSVVYVPGGLFKPWAAIGLWALTVPAVAYYASRMIDREDM